MANQNTGAAPEEAANDNLSEDSLMSLLGAEPDQTEEVETEEEEEESEQVEEADETNESEEEEADEEESEAENDQPEAEENPKKRQKSLDARFHKLTQEIKALKAENQKLKSPETKADPLAIEDSEPNPFAGIQTLEALKEQKANLTKTLKFTDRLLDEHDDAHLDDVIYSEGEKEFTKRSIKAAARNAREALDEHIPAQLKAIETANERAKAQAAFDAKAEEDVPEILDESSPVKAAFDVMKASPLLEKVRAKVPEIAPELNWLLAHAARSIRGGVPKTVKVAPAAKTAKTVTAKVPSSPSGNTAVSSKSSVGQSKAALAARQAFEKSGSSSDLERLLAMAPS